MFFVFDGVDGAGKSTQLDRFVQWLRDQGRDVVTCKDPGSTQLGARRLCWIVIFFRQSFTKVTREILRRMTFGLSIELQPTEQCQM
jgi:type II secretory ATPase GspE/PulE/Tfp pilus assembly ATPase PilB-like protein